VQVDRPHVERHPERRVQQHHAREREGCLDRVVNGEVGGQREDPGGHERHRVLDRGRSAEVDVGAEALLIDPACRDPEQRDQEQQHSGIDALLADQPARACRQDGGDAEEEGKDPAWRQPVAQEGRGKQCRGDGVHRHDHGAQHRRCAVLDRHVQRAELDGLHEQSGDGDVAELATRRPGHPCDLGPTAKDERRQPEPEHQHGHRRHGVDGQVADRVAEGVEERHGRRGSQRHAGGRHRFMLSLAGVAVQRVLAIMNDRGS